MVLNFRFYDDEGDEIEGELPAKHEVCGRCEGHGAHLRPAIGEYAYTREEFDEAFDDDESREQYFKRGGIYDVVCEDCQGRNVVLVVDEKACRTDEQKALLKQYEKSVREEADFERECAHERRMGY